MLVKLLICGLLIISHSVLFTRRYLEMEGLAYQIDRQAVLNTSAAVDGVPFAGEGIVESDNTLISPRTQTKCVYYHYIKEEYVQSGDSSYWRTLENEAKFVPFWIRDESGKLKIDLRNMDADFSGYNIKPTATNIPNPKNSELDCEPMLKDSEENVKMKGFWIFNPTQKYRINEFVLSPGKKVFVYGMVEKDDSNELVLREDNKHPLLVSKKDKETYLEDFFKGGNLVYAVHLLVALGFTISVFSLGALMGVPFAALNTLLLAGNALIVGSMIFSLYNRIVTLTERAKGALSNIEVELKRRADLIPNIVDIVKKYTEYEKTLNQITAETRAGIVFLKQNPGKEEKYEIQSLVGVIEKYPELKASRNFQSLMRELIDTEERIAYSRAFYNRTILKYNTLVQTFPFILVAMPMGFRQKEYLSISHSDKKTPKVSI
jgi:LemA protein